MSLEQSLKRLSLRPSSVCNQCRRAFATSTSQRQRQSATAAFAADLLQSRRNQISDSSSNSTSVSRDSFPAGVTTASHSLNAASTSPADQFPTETSTLSPTRDANFSLARQAVQTATGTNRQRNSQRQLLDQERGWSKADLERQMMHRRWQPGEVYAPHDLTGIEMAKWKKQRRREKPKYDVLDKLRINPLDHYKNFSMMSEYMTETGRIKHSNETNLRPVNQRKMAKAIRRAIGLGILMPSTHHHPELLRSNLRRTALPLR